MNIIQLTGNKWFVGLTLHINQSNILIVYFHWLVPSLHHSLTIDHVISRILKSSDLMFLASGNSCNNSEVLQK